MIGPTATWSEIQALFRDDDVRAMSWAFNLHDYREVRENAELIYDRIADGSMPCDEPWPDDRLQLLRSWIDAGMPG
jgi:hypothetical protein